DHTGTLSGLAGDDDFLLREAAVLTGNLLGGAGSDFFDFNDAGDAVRTARVIGFVDGGLDGGGGTDIDMLNFDDSELTVTVSILGNVAPHGARGTIGDGGVP